MELDSLSVRELVSQNLVCTLLLRLVFICVCLRGMHAIEHAFMQIVVCIHVIVHT